MPVSRNSRKHKNTGKLYTTAYSPYKVEFYTTKKGKLEVVKCTVDNPKRKDDANDHIILNHRVYHPENFHSQRVITEKEINSMRIK